jgi:hypothetical protein
MPDVLGCPANRRRGPRSALGSTGGGSRDVAVHRFTLSSVLFTSLFRPSAGRAGALVASLWQGEVPPGLRVERRLYLVQPRQAMLLVWDAGDDGERAWLEARMARYGELETWVTATRPPGW